MSVHQIIGEVLTGKWCFTCGETKDPRDFPWDDEQYDGLSVECGRCYDMRELARKIDGETGPREYAIEGEGRKSAPFNPDAAMWSQALDSALRRRPVSGLMSAEV